MDDDTKVWEETKQEFIDIINEQEAKKKELIENTPKNELYKIQDELEEIDNKILEAQNNLAEIDHTEESQIWDDENNKYIDKEELTQEEEVEDESTASEEEENKDSEIDDDYFLDDEEEPLEFNDDEGWFMDEATESLEEIDDDEYMRDESREPKMSERVTKIAREKIREQANSSKLNAKIWVDEKKQGVKNKIQDTKEAVLNSRPVRIARGVKNTVGKVYRGFKTAGIIAIGVGAITADALITAKEKIERIDKENIKNIADRGRDKANALLDKLEDKVIDKKLENLLKQQQLQQEADGR